MSSLYIHIPFCQKKCLYCSFAVVIAQEHNINSYLGCLRKEANAYKQLSVQTIHVGGGTPSFLNSQQMKRLFDDIYKNFYVAHDAEFAVECNPEGLTEEKLSVLRDGGVNRVSLGVQSFNDARLRYLGRCHDSAAAVKAFERLRAAGFSNINLDLMFSLPGEPEENLLRDLKVIGDLSPEHVSLYALTIEAPSRFFARQVKLPSEDIQVRQYRKILATLSRYGYRQYEVSNFSRPGYESRHNLNYWQGGNYIGLGMSAHSHRDGERYWNADKLRPYMEMVSEKGEAVTGREQLTKEKQFKEIFLFGLRMNEGVVLPALEEKFDYRFDGEEQKRLDEFFRQGFLERHEGRIRPTDRGRLVLDELSAFLI